MPFLTTFTQLTAQLKNFLRGWLSILGLKEGLVECATVCVKSEVILISIVDHFAVAEMQYKFNTALIFHVATGHNIQVLILHNLEHLFFVMHDLVMFG